MVTNTDRAAWADAALDAFRVLTGQTAPGETEEALGDLLCDLLHLAQAEGLEPLTLLERATWHYEYEILHPDA